MAHIGKGPNLNQGEGGATRKGPSGSHKDPKGEGRVNGQGPSGSKFEQGPNGNTSSTGDHLSQQPSNQHGKHAPQRGGHSRDGYPAPGGNQSGKSGSKDAQNPHFYR
jgi:hypothetical protein